MAVQLRGLYPPITTPFRQAGDLDIGALADNILHYNDTGLSGYVALGSNGEAVHLTEEERSSVIRAVKRAAEQGPANSVIAGVNQLSTRAAIESSFRAADNGADAVLVITPYFYKGAMSQNALARHFESVADRAPVPVILYNVPANTGVVLESATIAGLSSHQNIAGVKDSAGNIGALADTVAMSRGEFPVLSGNGGTFYPALMVGAVGAILAAACVAPRECVALFNHAVAGRHDEARELQNRIAALSRALTVEFGVAGLKYGVDTAGFNGGHCREPLLPLGEGARSRIKSVMLECGLFPVLG